MTQKMATNVPKVWTTISRKSRRQKMPNAHLCFAQQPFWRVTRQTETVP